MDYLTYSKRKSVMTSLDCLLSAALFNCCHFSCCMLDVPLIYYVSNRSNHDWINQLLECYPEIKLRDIIIPGTHDSGSYALHWLKFFSAVGRTQNLSILDQLNSGARYLDIRVAGGTTTGGIRSGQAESLSVWHGILECCSFQEVLLQIKWFLDNNPREFVFIEIVAESGRNYTNEQKMHTIGLLNKIIGEKCIKHMNRSQLMDEMTLSEIVVDRRKQILVIIHPRFYSNDDFEIQIQNDKNKMKKSSSIYIQETYGFVNGGEWFQSKWHDTTDEVQLLEKNLDEVQKQGYRSTDNSRNNKILCNQFVLTPGVDGVTDILPLLIGAKSLRPVSLTAKLYRENLLDRYFRTHAKKKWNIVALDYIDLAPSLMSFIINLNFPNRIQIRKAAVKYARNNNDDEITTIDITDKIHSKVQLRKVLYLIDIPNDLGLDCCTNGMILIAYKSFKEGQEESDGGIYSILTSKFYVETELIVGQFSHNEESCIFQFNPSLLSEECKHSGYIIMGHIFPRINPDVLSSKEKAICLRYTMVGAEEKQEYKFEILK